MPIHHHTKEERKEIRAKKKGKKNSKIKGMSFKKPVKTKYTKLKNAT